MQYAGSTFYILMVHSQLRRIHLLRHLILSPLILGNRRSLGSAPCCTSSECSVHFMQYFWQSLLPTIGL